MLLAALTLAVVLGPAEPPPPPETSTIEASAEVGGSTPELSAETKALEAKVLEIFDDECTLCHSEGGDPTDPGGFNLEVPLLTLINAKSVVNDKPMVVPGKPDQSYLLIKMNGKTAMDGGIMPEGGPPLPAEQLKAVEDWINSLPADAGASAPAPAAPKGTKPFHGTEQIVLPTTMTLGKRTLQYRIDHRFGRIGTERGAFGLDAGVVMSMGLQYGILDGWDVRIRRTNARKGWEFGTKYIALRQEEGQPLSLGGYVSMDIYADFEIKNRVAGNFIMMISRLWFERWSTMLTFGYSLRTNHNTVVTIDFQDANGPVPVEDKRGTLNLGFVSTVWLGKKKRWGLDLEYLLPVPAQGTPDFLYYNGGDADPGGTKLGAWALGGSYYTGKHFFQVFFTNNRNIHINGAAPGGQTKNPFKVPGQNSKNPFNDFNFFLGFNLGRTFTF